MFSRILQEGHSVPTTGTAPKPSPRIREKRHRRRTEILHAALRAFREKGYHATTLDDIANHLGVQKTALYHYFPDKESILYQCHLESLAEVERFSKEARRRYATAADRLAYIIREHVRVMTETLEASPLAFEVTALSSERQKKIIAARDRYERRIRRIINEGIKSGEFRVVNSKIAVFGILGAINWIARWYRPVRATRSLSRKSSTANTTEWRASR
jgi:TetR/AcrR family transcriptional regulator